MRQKKKSIFVKCITIIPPNIAPLSPVSILVLFLWYCVESWESNGTQLIGENNNIIKNTWERRRKKLKGHNISKRIALLVFITIQNLKPILYVDNRANTSIMHNNSGFSLNRNWWIEVLGNCWIGSNMHELNARYWCKCFLAHFTVA